MPQGCYSLIFDEAVGMQQRHGKACGRAVRVVNYIQYRAIHEDIRRPQLWHPADHLQQSV